MRILIALLLTVGLASAENIYIAQTALGSGNGSSAANAASVAFFNTASNWNSSVANDGKIGPGDTVRFVGNLVGPANVQGSGISGNRITLTFEPTGKFSAPVLPTNGALHLGTASHITVDGGNTGTVGARATVDGSTWNVNFECTDNGTPALGYGNAAQARGINSDGGTNVTVRNIYSRNLYFKQPGSIESTAFGLHITLRGTQNISVENCYIVEGVDGINIHGQGTMAVPATGINVSDCTVFNVSNGIKPAGVVSMIGATVLRNRLNGFSKWSADQVASTTHQDGIQTVQTNAPSGPVSKNIATVVAYNWIGPDMGTRGHTTAAIFLEHDAERPLVYNNLVTFLPGHWTSNPAIQVVNSGANTWFPGDPPGLIANNTVIGGNAGGKAYANLHHDMVGNISIGTQEALTRGTVSTGISNYNVYWGTTSNTNATFYTGAAIYSTLAAWQAGQGIDLQSIAANPLVNADGTLTAASPARNFAPVQTAFTDDFYGNTRVAVGGKWDAGAFAFAAAGPVPPAVASSAINSTGTQFSVVMTEAVVFGSGGSGGMTVTSPAGGTVTLGTPSIIGSTITWPITNRLIGQGETLTRTYVQPGNGIEAQDDQLDLASFSALAITNGSTVVQAATPQFAPLPGAYSSTQNVTMTSATPQPPGATIRYTTDGTDPTASSTLYTAPIPTNLSTTYKARAFATGYLDSPIATGVYQIGDFVITSAWTNVAVTSQTGTFTWTFRATPSAAGLDGLVALADHNAAAFSDLAVIARFNPSGNIDAMNTSAYAAVNTFPYIAGQAYDFVVTVNIPNHTFSMTVVQAGGSTPTTIATNYAFRNTQATVNHLDVFSGITSLGTVTVSNMIFTGAAPTLSLTGIATNTTGTQITATFNSQPSFGLGGQGGFTVSAFGGATTPSAPTVGTNSITWNLSRAIGRGESITAAYVQPGNGIEAAVGGSDLASFSGQSVANNSTVDLTAPTPNPSTFGIAPTALTSSTITMTATTSTDAFSSPVQYFFNEVSGNAGGSDSGWQSSSTFTDAGLAAGTQYRYRVQVRDSAVPPNVTTFSQEFSATTKSVAGARPAQPFNMARANIVTP